MRRFKLVRHEDVSEVSGTGDVATGCYWTETGIAVLHWAGDFPTANVHPLGIESVVSIHGHQGKTELVWLDDEDGYPL